MKEQKNENLIEYNKLVNAKLLNDNPHYKDDVLDAEINKFLEENKEFQLLLERNKKRREELENNKVLEDKEPRYLKLYLDDISNLINLGEKQKNLLLAIFEQGYVSIKGNIELTSRRKKILAKKLNQKDFSNYYKVLKQLQLPIVELNNTPVLAPIQYDDEFDDGIERYYINPFLLGNGSWANIKNRRLRIILDYQNDDRKITIENLAKLEDEKMQVNNIDTSFLDKPAEPSKEPESSIFDDFDEEITF